MTKLLKFEEFLNEGKLSFKIGDKVKLADDVMQKHAKSVPAHAGYTSVQFKWRETLNNLSGKIGTIQRVFPNSDHVNVDFDGELIGIESSQLIKI